MKVSLPWLFPQEQSQRPPGVDGFFCCLAREMEVEQKKAIALKAQWLFILDDDGLADLVFA